MIIPRFRFYGEDDPAIEQSIQPVLNLRKWIDLEKSEKVTALQQLKNHGWLSEYSEEILQTIEYLNDHFLRQCPGKRLHRIQPESDTRVGCGNQPERMKAAQLDFCDIFSSEKSEALILRMFSVFANAHIDRMYYGWAQKEKSLKKKKENIDEAFEKFDRLSNCFNHIFEQFSVNIIFTRNGLVPRQDVKISERIYEPTLSVLSDPKWKTVSDDLSEMFDDYRNENYSEVITKAHRAIQRFLQILVGEEGKNGKGEIGMLFKEAKKQKIIPASRFSESIINTFQGFISSERATNSTAKPALKDATSADALLVMNVVMVFLQHCLQGYD